MRVVHWSLNNGSGLNRVAVNMAAAERRMGLDSVLSLTGQNADQVVASMQKDVPVLTEEEASVSDIHVIHSHKPDHIKGKTIFLPHGTPEHCFTGAIEQYSMQGHIAHDPFMLSMYRINHCDMTVTFWRRHKYIWQTLCPKADIRVIPMGVDYEFWQGGPQSLGKYVGTPSFLTSENCHTIKWPLDVILAFPRVMDANPGAVFHIHYLPVDQHRWWYPLLFSSGVAYKSYTSGHCLSHEELRNAFRSVDYYVSPVRYGDFNNTCLEAKVAGCKVISYRGNEYADFWITEGDQQVMADEITDIIQGRTLPRELVGTPEPISAMAEQMISIYEEIACLKG